MAKLRTDKRESGHPGGGVGRKDKVGPSGVYRMSGPHPPGEAPLLWPGTWGQGKRGAAGYEDHGDSEWNVRRVRPERCRDIMTKDPVFCQASDTALIAAKLMRTHNIGALPVVGNLHGRKLVGIVTDRDLAMKIVAAAHDSKYGYAGSDHVASSCRLLSSPDDQNEKTLDLMEHHQIKRVPVVDKFGRVVGMISEAEVALRVGDARRTAELATSLCQPV